MKRLTNQERMRRLIENHNEHINSIMLNFANQFHQLATELEDEEEIKRLKEDYPNIPIELQGKNLNDKQEVQK